MTPSHSQNRIYAPILFGVALLIGVVFFKPLYTGYMDNLTETNTLTKNVQEAEQKIAALQKMQEGFRTGTGQTDLINKVKKIDKKWSEADLFSAVALNRFTQNTGVIPAQIALGTISVDKGKKLSNGLSLWTVNFVVSATSVDAIIDYITYLTTESDFIFTIDSISLPIDTAPTDSSQNGGVTLSLALGVYYFE